MEFDVIIIGSGLAGMAAALELAPRRRVALVAKGPLMDGASPRAQGGIAAPLALEDSVADHVRDTLTAGAGLSDATAARQIIAQARDAIAWLQHQGVGFTRAGDALHLTQEGGHGRRRIVHSADATGRCIMDALHDRVRRQPGITLLPRHFAIDVIQRGAAGTPCQGVRLLDIEHARHFDMMASHVILASGGAGQVYDTTSAPPSATGDGIAMAWRAGCRIANMAFTQFHPTGLHHPQSGGFLISEAVRGEGGLLRLPGGQRFMSDHDPRAELAPRDIVARAIHHEMRRHGLDCVHLDIRHRPRDFLLTHFPTIHAHCQALGIDMAVDPIPVAPTAHYTCGGIVADTAGRTEVANLYAVGEAACTGLHGANRLASNSLLECVVMGRSAARDILLRPAASVRHAPAAPTRAQEPDAQPRQHAEALRATLRRLMSLEVGVVRTDAGLLRAKSQIGALTAQIKAYCDRDGTSMALLELRNLAQVATLIVHDAIAQCGSRGAHFNADRPWCGVG